MSKITLKRPKSLWLKTFFIVIAGEILIFCLFAVMYSRTVKIMTEKNNSLFENTVYQVAERCRQQVEQMEKMVRGIAGNQWIKNYLSGLENGSDTYQMTNVRIVREVLRERNVDLADNIYVYTQDYKPINCYYSQAIFDTEQRYQEYLKNYRRFSNGEIAWKVIKKEPYTLEAVAYIHDGSKVYGLLAVQFSEEIFREIFLSGNDNRHEEMLLKNENGQILYANDKEKINKLYAEMIKDGSSYSVSYPLEHFQWQLSGILHSGAVTQDLNEILWVLIGVFVCIGVLGIAVAVTVFRSFLHPMNQIIYGMEKIQKGELEFTMTREKQDEFGVIIDNFNNMVVRIRELLSAVQNQRNNYYRLEMLALKSKLNPHFLYNAFDLIYWKLVLKNEYEIADVVVTLADILRYCVNYKKEFVSVREDMQYISSYLFFQNLLLNDRLEYKIDIPENLMEYEIPKLLLQPLIENAVKYGADERGGKITVSAREEEEYIIFQVADKGKGIAPEVCRELLNGKEEKGGFGIRLVKAIVRSTYGEDCGIVIDSEQGRGTCIRVVIRKKIPDIKNEMGTNNGDN